MPSAIRVDLMLFRLVVACQLATVAITWPIWQARIEPPNLPALDLPPVSFGPLLVGSLLLAFALPRPGFAVALATTAIACLFDQTRIQPQFIAMFVLMAGCLGSGRWFARWFLAAMWSWSGLHKWLSPEWFAEGAQIVLTGGVDTAASSHLAFAYLAAVYEIALGALTVARPRLAAAPCAALHLGILLLLSPLVANWNASVWPWNLATAVTGSWLLWSSDRRLPGALREWLVVLALFVVPAGFYWGVVDARLAHVLYSGNLPAGTIFTHEGRRRIGWSGGVPFPAAHRLFVQHFAATGKPGEKLAIRDPRPFVDDRYFRMEDRVVEIGAEEFRRGPGVDPVATRRRWSGARPRPDDAR